MSLRARLQDERGLTIVELLIVCVTMGIVLTGIVNVLVSGARAGADADARFQAQQDTRLALDRIQYEGRCASVATLVGGGAGVTFTLPAICAHAHGTVTWCASSGQLVRYVGSACSGSGQPFVDGLTDATPFALPAPPQGHLPQLQVTFAVNVAGRASDGFTLTDAITLRNATPAS
jgi:type II secretory pathway pseudopilin PulG